jgi:hypothetical protein
MTALPWLCVPVFPLNPRRILQQRHLLVQAIGSLYQIWAFLNRSVLRATLTFLIRERIHHFLNVVVQRCKPVGVNFEASLQGEARFLKVDGVAILKKVDAEVFKYR